MNSVKPFLKWVGGKTQLLADVLAAFPTQMASYHEPFLGGGSVLLAVLTARAQGQLRITGTVYASDVNADLINLYTWVQRNPDALLTDLAALVDPFLQCDTMDGDRSPSSYEEAIQSQESFYYWTRAQFNAMTPEQRLSARAAATVLFLNKTCFRGVYRSGPKGFNVPFGHNKNPGIYEAAHLRQVSALLQGVVFTPASFETSLARVAAGDFTYLDPPYVPEAATSFVGYTPDGFDLKNHQTLFSMCHRLRSAGTGFLLSNADVPLVRDAFPAPYVTRRVEARRLIHSKKPETRTMEVLITV